VSATRGSVTTAHYALHEYDREKRDALSRWATRLEAIVVGASDDRVIEFPGPTATG
jgi:hypothetical protein